MLIVTMWITLVLAGLVLVLAGAMRVEAIGSGNGAAGLKADAIEQGAVQYVLAHVDQLHGKMPADEDMPCEAVQLGDGLFWLLKPNFEDDRSYAFGVVDEGSKLNLNVAGTNQLRLLTGMTDELAACIYDWRRDYTNGPSSDGAMSEYYLRLNDPYVCKNSPFETVEELFLVKGATTSILFGEDINRNGVLDPNEDDAGAAEPPDNKDGKLDRGIWPFLTVWSVEPDTTADGSPRTNVNGGGVVVSGTNAPPTLMAVLNANLSPSRFAAVMLTINPGGRSRLQFNSVLDFYVQAKLTPEEFATIADQLTAATGGAVRPGLINVNTAPREVLACLPGLEDADVQALVTARSGSETDTSNLAWVATALGPVKASAIGCYVTVRTFLFSADIVSVSGDGRAFRRCRIVVDAQKAPPRVLYRQDLTRLGWPLDESLLDRLRAGVGPEEIAAERTFRMEANP